jgi:hypothetical protein
MEAHWIVLCVVIVPFWLLQNVIHELSHGLTLKLGWKWNFEIWPFPSNRLGRFTFACITYEENLNSKNPGDSGWALVSIMPRIINIILIFLLVSMLALCTNKIISIILLVFVWTNLIDFCVGLLSSLKKPNQSDIWEFQKYLGVPVNYLRYSCVGFVIYQSVAVIVATLIKLL